METKLVEYKKKLESQIREAYGRVVYTETCHNKKVNFLELKNKRIKFWQIVLSALSTGGFFSSVALEKKYLTLLSGLISLALLILNSYTKNFKLIEEAEKHKKAADLLWAVKQEYLSLLTDLWEIPVDEIVVKRAELLKKTETIYSNSPRTDKASYLEAQKALKTEEEQTFSEKEIDVMLPKELRRESDI